MGIASCYAKSTHEMNRSVGFEPPDAALVRNVVNSLQSKLLTRGVTICISGMDGSGKTTTAEELVRLLNASDIRVRHLHLYQWYVNVLITPLLLLHNQYIGRKVLVLDRTIYDNVAVAAIRQHCPVWLMRMALALVASCYPNFTYRFYLVAPLPELCRRRPGMSEARFAALREAYERVVLRARCTRVSSDARLFAELLRNIAQVT